MQSRGKWFFYRYSLKCLALFSLVTSLLFPIGSSALFEAGSSASNAHFVSSVLGEGNQKIIWIGLDIDLKPGWHTYWRTPGASGYGLKIDWTGSKNLKSAELFWPAPGKFETFNLIANGYEKEVIFPIKVTLEKPHTPLFLHAKLDYLACDAGNCIPQSKTITLMIPDAPNTPSIDAKRIDTALKHLPKKNNPDLKINSLQFIPHDNEAATLRIAVFHKLPLTSPQIFVEASERLFFDKATIISSAPSGEGKVSILDIPIYKNEKKDFIHAPNLIGKKLTVTFENGNNVTEATATVTAEPLSLEGKFLMYGFALIGGLILNFMPCVLPVVLLKVFSLTKHHGKSTRHIRKALFISVLGILASFMVLGLLPIIFGLLGGSFGWGMQFQEPVFVVFMMLVLAVFAANFWGWFEIILPDNITTLGYDYSDREGDMGHFLSGMFTTLLATPCSAPFLGTALTFALSQGPREILVIFFFLGIGLSLPLLLVMAFPKIVSFLPKPGKWMLTFKKALGWGFFLTMLWLFYVLNSQVSLLTLFAILFAMLLLIFIFWLHHKIPSYKRLFILFASIIPIFSFTILAVEYIKPPTQINHKVDMKQIAARIKSDLNAGKLVFVDITADWCLTCKANELLVLDTNSVKNLIKKDMVDFIKIDWTSRDPEVFEYLKSFNHDGIPFYVVYGPQKPYGQALPQILTYPIIDNAFKKAK